MEDKQKEDHQRFFIAKGDPGFSEKRNKAIIEGTIKKYEAMRKRKERDYEDAVRERADAVATYLKAVDMGAQTPVEKYFSRSELAYLRGEKIVEKIRGKMRILEEIGG